MIKADINKLIELCKEQLEKQYVHGSHGPSDFDCAGLVWYLYNQIYLIDIYLNGYGLSTTTKIMTSEYGNLTIYDESSFKSLDELQLGDILLFHRQSLNDNVPKEDNKYPGHCGIYLGNNKFIHCPRTKGKVVISSLKEDKYWYRKLVGSIRIIENNSVQKRKIKELKLNSENINT